MPELLGFEQRRMADRVAKLLYVMQQGSFSFLHARFDFSCVIPGREAIVVWKMGKNRKLFSLNASVEMLPQPGHRRRLKQQQQPIIYGQTNRPKL